MALKFYEDIEGNGTLVFDGDKLISANNAAGTSIGSNLAVHLNKSGEIVANTMNVAGTNYKVVKKGDIVKMYSFLDNNMDNLDNVAKEFPYVFKLKQETKTKKR